MLWNSIVLRVYLGCRYADDVCGRRQKAADRQDIEQRDGSVQGTVERSVQRKFVACNCLADFQAGVGQDVVA